MRLLIAVVFGFGCSVGVARAALPVGAVAPDFSLMAAQGGRVFGFHLAEALKQGPVVLYFYPAAFTSGCTEEAHEFADAVPRFAALHATVIGVSMDKIETLQRFSLSECRSRFAVGADGSGAVSRAYDSVLIGMLGFASRTSYVIAPDGHVLYQYSAMDPSGHVGRTLQAVSEWAAAHPGG